MPSAENVAQRLAKADEEFEVLWKQFSKGQPIIELKKSLCEKSKEKQFRAAQKQRFESNKYAPALLPAFERSQSALDRLCSCGDNICLRDSLKASIREGEQDEAQSCQISSSAWKTQFRRAGESWVSMDSTEAPRCYSSVTTTLSCAKDSDRAWNMRTVKVPNPNAADSKFCMNVIEDYVDNWKSYGAVPLTCKSLKL